MMPEPLTATRDNLRGGAAMKIVRIEVITLLAMSLLLLGGCAHLLGNAKTADALRARVEQEWNAKKAGEWGTVYDLTCKAYKSQVNRDHYIKGANLSVEGFTVKDVAIDSAQGKGTATVSFDVVQMGFPFKGILLKEDWIWEDGDWRLNLNPKRTPFDK
jgi:hypothetical protein